MTFSIANWWITKGYCKSGNFQGLCWLEEGKSRKVFGWKDMKGWVIWVLSWPPEGRDTKYVESQGMNEWWPDKRSKIPKKGLAHPKCSYWFGAMMSLECPELPHRTTMKFDLWCQHVLGSQNSHLESSSLDFHDPGTKEHQNISVSEE